MRETTTTATRQSTRAFVGLFLIAAATLLLEIAWTRVLSVTLWYHFAFLALSTALFGFGAAGVLLSLRAGAGPLSDRAISRFALATPIAFVLGYAVSNQIPFEPFSLGHDPAQWGYLLLFYLVSTLPFLASGLTVAALLSRHAGEVHRLYLFDLVGAGVGAVLAVALLPITGGTGTMLVAAGMAGMGGALVAHPLGKPGRVVVLLSVALFAIAPFGDALMPVRISSNKTSGDGVPIAKVFASPEHHLYTGWNATSRVDVVRWRDRHQRVHRTIFIDGGTALTRIARPEGPLSQLAPGTDEESFFLGLSPKPRVLVLGSGGGREVLLALRSRASKVTAVEINPDINFIVGRLMADFTGDLYASPRVTVHTDEARHFINRTTERFDVIHCPHTISNAAMASGSLSLAENYLLTIEAFDIYLSRLAENGVLLITRPEAHLPRLFATARAALPQEEARPLEQRVMAWRSPTRGQSFYAGVALKKSAFTSAEVDRFEEVLERQRLEPVYLPGRPAGAPYAGLVRGEALDRIPLAYPAILEPATDDMPFFNRRVPFSELSISDITAIFSRGRTGRLALENRPVTEATLVALLAESALAALLLILGPLVLVRRRALAGQGQIATMVAFFALGLAYITVEMGIIHRLTLYLGRPAVVLAVVLGALLTSSGLGSAFSARFKGKGAAWRAALAAGVMGLATARLLSSVVEETLVLPEPLRVLLAVGLVAIPGFVMGMPFPLLIRRLRETRPERIPWAFGINGLASVIGTVTALLIAMTLGQTAVILAGVLCYGLAAAAAARI